MTQGHDRLPDGNEDKPDGPDQQDVRGGPEAGDTPWYLGIDIGGTKVALRAESEAGRVQEVSFAWVSRAGAGPDLARLAAHVGALTVPARGPLRAVGVALPATVGPDERVTTWPSRPEWTGLPVGPALRGMFPGSALAWADDGDVAALAEAESAGCDDLLYLGVGTGVGGGLVLGSRLCPGLGRGSFEIGHMIVELDGADCACGRRGCLQAIAGGAAVLAQAARLRGGPVTFGDLREGLFARRPWALAPVDRACSALAAAILSVGELVHPRLALLGGGFATGLPGLADSVAEHLTRLARPGQSPPPVAPAQLGALSSLHGAVLLARRLSPPRHGIVPFPEV